VTPRLETPAAAFAARLEALVPNSQFGPRLVRKGAGHPRRRLRASDTPEDAVLRAGELARSAG